MERELRVPATESLFGHTSVDADINELKYHSQGALCYDFFANACVLIVTARTVMIFQPFVSILRFHHRVLHLFAMALEFPRS